MSSVSALPAPVLTFEAHPSFMFSTDVQRNQRGINAYHLFCLRYQHARQRDAAAGSDSPRQQRRQYA
jgi:hypothetical protein